MPSIWIAGQIEVVKPGFHPRLHARRRQRHEAAGGRRLRQPRPVGRRNVSLGQPDRTLETPRRDVDQHLVHRPFAEQVFADGVRPARQYALGPVEPANPWALDLDLATVKTDLAFGPPPAVRLAPLTRSWRSPQAAVASCSSISLSVSSPAARQKCSKLADRLASASAFGAYVGIAVDVVCFFMALLSTHVRQDTARHS